jgi:hypothetical protein
VTSPAQQQRWVTYKEPNPAQIEIVAVETAPSDDADHDRRCAELEASGHHAYVITASDKDEAGDIALQVWAEELVGSQERLADADAYLATNKPTD